MSIEHPSEENFPLEDTNDIESMEGESRLSREQVADRLRTNPEDLSPLTQFMEERERNVTNSREGLQLIIDGAWIKEACGNFPDAASEDYLAAAEQAWQEGLDDLSREFQWRVSAVAGPPDLRAHEGG